MYVLSIGTDVKESQQTGPSLPTHLNPLGNTDANSSNDVEPYTIEYQKPHTVGKVSGPDRSGRVGMSGKTQWKKWSPQRVLKGTSLLCQTGEEGEGGATPAGGSNIKAFRAQDERGSENIGWDGGGAFLGDAGHRTGEPRVGENPAMTC